MIWIQVRLEFPYAKEGQTVRSQSSTLYGRQYRLQQGHEDGKGSEITVMKISIPT